MCMDFVGLLQKCHAYEPNALKYTRDLNWCTLCTTVYGSVAVMFSVF